MRHAVILAGGGGTRLWPASRRSRPKQFLALGTGSQTLLAATATRLVPACGERLWVVTTAEQADLVHAAWPALAAHHLIAEPAARNTAAALGLAAIRLLHSDPKAVMAAIPSDQHIGKPEEFLVATEAAFAAAEEHDAIVTIGIVPTRADTGYGYLKLGPRVGEAIGDVVGETVRSVEKFVEKPSEELARQYVESGDYLWNGGMFFCKAQHLLDEICKYLPEVAHGLDEIRAALGTTNAKRVCEAIYPTLPAISIDFGVMEHTRPVLTVAGDFGWSDVGSWTAMADTAPADSEGNVIVGSAVTHDARGNIIVGEEGCVIAVAGVDNLVIVRSGNALLVVPRERCQDVRSLVEAMKRGDLEQFL